MNYTFERGKFTEPELEKAIIELFAQQEYTYICGYSIHRKYEDILLLDDLRSYIYIPNILQNLSVILKCRRLLIN